MHQQLGELDKIILLSNFENKRKDFAGGLAVYLTLPKIT